MPDARTLSKGETWCSPKKRLIPEYISRYLIESQ